MHRVRSKSFVVYFSVFVLTMACGSKPGLANTSEWYNKPIHYVAVSQSLRELLHELALTASVPIIVSEQVHGQVNGRWPQTSAGSLLDELARTYGLSWYFDGSVLSVSTLSESETKLLMLHGIKLERLRLGLKAASFMDERFSLRPGPVADTAIAAGPPRFLAVVEQSLDAIVASDGALGTANVVSSTGSSQVVYIYRGSSTSAVKLN